MIKAFELFLLCITVPFSISAITIGSDTAPSRFPTSQVLGNGDRVAGFAALEGGLSLFSSVTTSTWDSFFNVSGPITLNGGTLVLNTDFLCADECNFTNLGNITGRGHNIEFSSTITIIPSTTMASNPNNSLSLITSVAAPAGVLSTGWSFDSQFLAAGNQIAGAGNQLALFSFDGISLTLQAQTTQGAQVNDIVWSPNDYYLAVAVNNNAGSEVVIYAVNPLSIGSSTVASSFGYGGNSTSLAYHPAASYLAMGGTLFANQLLVFPISGTGVLGSPVIINTGNSVSTRALSWNSSGTKLGVGLTAGTSALRVYNFVAPSTLTLNGSVNLSPTTAVGWHPSDPALITVGSSVSPQLRLYRHNPGAGTLTLIASVATGFQVNQIDWDPTGEWLIAAENTSNTLGLYDYNMTTSTFSSTQNITGLGTGNTTTWSPNGNYVAMGSNNSNIYIYGFYTPLINQCYTFSDVTLVLNNDITFNNLCLTFVGNCEICGNSAMLDLLSSSTITIGANSRLTMKNLTLSGIAGTNLNANGATSRLVLENSNINLSNNYIWGTGGFDIKGNVLIGGAGYAFVYQTDQVSTISAYSSLIVDTGVTFSYAPITNTRNNLIFENSQAQLIFNSANLVTSTTGILFTKGMISIEGESSFTPSNATSGAITLGDGSNAQNDATLHLMPGATLNLTQGFLKDNNV